MDGARSRLVAKRLLASYRAATLSQLASDPHLELGNLQCPPPNSLLPLEEAPSFLNRLEMAEQRDTDRASRTVHVKEYYRKDGTLVRSHYRRRPAKDAQRDKCIRSKPLRPSWTEPSSALERRLHQHDKPALYCQRLQRASLGNTNGNTGAKPSAVALDDEVGCMIHPTHDREAEWAEDRKSAFARTMWVPTMPRYLRRHRTQATLTPEAATLTATLPPPLHSAAELEVDLVVAHEYAEAAVANAIAVWSDMSASTARKEAEQAADGSHASVLAFGKEAEHAADGSHASVIAFGSAQATAEDRQRKKDAAAAAKTAKRSAKKDVAAAAKTAKKSAAAANERSDRYVDAAESRDQLDSTSMECNLDISTPPRVRNMLSGAPTGGPRRVPVRPTRSLFRDA
jgi:hypothetical protein